MSINPLNQVYPTNKKVMIVINNGGGQILPSETFLRSHIESLPCRVVPLIGVPGYRILVNEGNAMIPSSSLFSLVKRGLLRRLKFTTLAAQDRRALSHFLRSREIDVVLAEYGPTAVSVMGACADAKVALVAHFHGFDAYRETILFTYRAQYLELFKQAAAVIAVSSHMREHLLQLGAVPEKTFHNSCGAQIPADIRVNLLAAGKRIIMVGRLVEKKAPFLSIMAFAKIAAVYEDAVLEVIGDGPLMQVCMQIAKSLGLEKRIIFKGTMPHPAVLDAMAAARCLIQHSVCAPDGDREGTPVTVLEAMGLGLPVVATRHGGIMDVIEDGKNGILVNEYDVEAMSDAIFKYINDADFASKIGNCARDTIMQNWTSEKKIQSLWQIIDNV